MYKVLLKFLKVSFNRNNRGKIITWNALSKRKKSDTLVILGGGKSINEISKDHWQEFAGCDTIGFNFWPVHEFVPSFYFFETPRDTGRYDVFKRLFLFVEEQYRSSLVIYKDFRFSKDSILRERVLNVGLFMDFFSVPGSSLRYFRSSLSIINFFYKYKLFRSINFGKRASIIGLLFLGIKMRYKRIIICGIDLTNSDYFYDQSFRKNPSVPEDVVSSLRGENNKVFSSESVHKTNNKTYGELIVEDLVMLLSKHKISKDTSLFVYNNSSLLSKHLPTYN